jgi:hypothetical protein
MFKRSANFHVQRLCGVKEKKNKKKLFERGKKRASTNLDAI